MARPIQGPQISAVCPSEPQLSHWHADPSCSRITWSAGLYPPFDMDPKDLPHSLNEFLDLFCGNARIAVRNLFRTLQEEGKPFAFEAQWHHPDHPICRVEITATAEIGTNGRVTAICGIIRDTTEEYRLKAELDGQWANAEHERAQLEQQAAELVGLIEEREETRQQLLEEVERRKELEAQLRHLASTDPLTNLANRRHFLDTAKRETAQAQRYKHPLSVICWDIDHFKKINDTYGHAAGDDALRAISAISLDQCRQENDLLARMGGEEFALLLPETNLQSAHRLAERLRTAIESGAIPIAGETKHLTCSFGVAERRDGEADIAETLKRADQALYRAKETGRNRVEIDRSKPAPLLVGTASVS